MTKVIILDLDGTLVNTSALEPLRQSGRWREIKHHLDRCTVFESVLGLINTARSSGIKIAVFTNSPSQYANSLLKHFDISVDLVVAFHDVRNHKPAPDGVNAILEHFSIPREDAVYLGDHALDRLAAQNSGVEFFAVEWGNVVDLDESHLGVKQLSEFIGSRLPKTSVLASRSKLVSVGNKIFLGYYLDGIKEEVWSFKDSDKSAVDRWIGKTLELCGRFPKVDIVVRALGHAELDAGQSDTPLDALGKTLSKKLDAKYLPTLVSKSRALQKSTGRSAAERTEQVKGVYSVSREELCLETEDLTFLVIDDVYTTGATTSDISRAITKAYPSSRIYILTLVKTIYRKEAKKGSVELQHNTQLFSDLYNPLDSMEGVSGGKSLETTHRVKDLTSKRYSANYSNTNNNFIFQNLPVYSIESEPQSIDLYSAIQVIKNMLQRGKPTVASRFLRAAFGLGYEESGIDFDPLPLISREPISWKRLIRGDQRKDYFPAKTFFEKLLPKYFGEYSFVKQLTVPEVQIYDTTQVYVEHFENRQVDFFIPQAGAVIEIDGQQHKHSAGDDQQRDEFLERFGLRVFRFTTEEISSENDQFVRKMQKLRAFIELIDHLEQSGALAPPNGITLRQYADSFEFSEKDGLDVRLRLTAALRFQLLLIEFIERGVLRLGQPSKITIVNRDGIMFADEALQDLNNILSNLFCLQGSSMGTLELEIEELAELPTDRDGASLLVDFSLFRRFDDQNQVNQDVVFARTDYFDFYRHFPSGNAFLIENCQLVEYDYFKISCAQPIEYSLDLSPGSLQRSALRYFLSNLFLPFLKDVDFREGQVGIIGSALSRNSTIGLLPTGSGKSICYQLAAVLQPAVSFVVCPIKSLMYDQKVDLDSIGFTRSNYITSDLKAEEKERVQRDFGQGKYYFVFVSPERFQTLPFRQEMSAIGLDMAFAYAVIDEAHCLSEWGHDFRTSYLNLANTIERFAPGANYIGLTATASVNVLKDIQTEFDIPDEFIRTPLDFTREELRFHVIDDKGLKNEAIVSLVKEMESKWKSEGEESSKAGIIFTPTVNGKKGCFGLAGILSSALEMDVRYFSGSRPKQSGLSDEEFDAYKREVQNDFKNNEYNLLTATKAFGMGVNKGNVAYTVHYGIPGSMEALYQEAGRAGRDKRLFQEAPADCYVLLTKEPKTEVLDAIWDQATSVNDLKNYAKSLTRTSDLNTNLFLLVNGLDTINDDYQLISKIYAYLDEIKDQKSVKLTARQFETNKFKLEKAIYRLSQLGIVTDWIIENFFNGTLQVEFEIPSEGQLERNIEKTVGKYSADFRLADVFDNPSEYYKIICERLNKGSINKVQFLFLVLLLWSYDHFVYNRRQSQKNVYDRCVEVASGEMSERDFKTELEGYFKHNKSSQLMSHLAENSADTGLWLSVLYSEPDGEGTKYLISQQEITILNGQLSRFLESYKDNMCLDYLSGVLRLISDQFDDADGERRMSSALDKLLIKDKDSAIKLVRETLDLKSLFSSEARSKFAKLIHEKFNETALLEEVNEVLEDSYSYHALLFPLASRLNILTQKYDGIDW